MHIDRSARVATELHTHLGHDLRLSKFELFGSAARAIVVDRAFGANLEEKNLVTVDQVPYGYFFSKPWKTETLTKLGITYLLVKQGSGANLAKLGWVHVVMKEIVIFRNPQNGLFTSKIQILVRNV